MRRKEINGLECGESIRITWIYSFNRVNPFLPKCRLVGDNFVKNTIEKGISVEKINSKVFSNNFSPGISIDFFYGV